MVEAFIIILTVTELLYVLLVHAGLYSSRYGPGYRDTDYGMGTHPTETGVKGTTGVTGSRVWSFYICNKLRVDDDDDDVVVWVWSLIYFGNYVALICIY